MVVRRRTTFTLNFVSRCDGCCVLGSFAEMSIDLRRERGRNAVNE